MATKYRLERGVHVERLNRKTPFRRLGHAGPESDRRRMLVLFAAFVLFVLALLGFTRIQGGAEYFRQPLQRDTGTVLEKVEERAEQGKVRYVLRLRLSPASGGELEARAEIDAALWSTLKVGDRIMVEYRINWRKTEARVVETGRVALPETIL